MPSIILGASNSARSDFVIICLKAVCSGSRILTPPVYVPNQINPDLSLLSGVAQKYWKESTGSIVEMSAQEKTDIDVDLTPETATTPATICFSSVDAVELGNGMVKDIGASAAGNFIFTVPDDFDSLVSLELQGFPTAGAAGAGKDADLASSYGAENNDELANEHTEVDTTLTFTFGMTLLCAGFDPGGVGPKCPGISRIPGSKSCRKKTLRGP